MSTRILTFSRLLLFAGAAACSTPWSGRGDDAGGGGKLPDVPEPQAPGQTPTPSGTPVTYPAPCHELYQQDALPTFELEIAPAELAGLREEAPEGIEVWHPAVFRFEGEELPAMVRNRGNKPSCGAKLQLAISFNRVDDHARFRGLRRLNLDTGHCRIMDERLALAFARDTGIPAPCANHARLEINGVYEGLFTNIEVQNKDYLTRIFGPDGDGGNLWKEGSDLKTNEEDPYDDTTLKTWKHAEDLATLEALGDLDQAVTEWAMEAVIPATDNFWVDGWNYYLYEHPDRGFVYLPRDFDKAIPWTPEWTVFDPVTTAMQHPTTIVLADPSYEQKYIEAVKNAASLYDEAVFEERIYTWWDQIDEAAMADPTLGIDPGEGPPARLLELIPARARYLRERMAELED